MTATKISFSEIIISEGFKINDAGDGKRWTKYPNGNDIKIRNARYILVTSKKYFAANSIDSLLITAFRGGFVDLYKYGYNTCDRCSGTGKLGHYAHVYGGDCFKCSGAGVI